MTLDHDHQLLNYFILFRWNATFMDYSSQIADEVKEHGMCIMAHICINHIVIII